MKDRIKKKITKMKRREVLELLDLAMRKNEGKADIFFEFSGHVNLISIRIHKDGWQNAETTAMKCYTDHKYMDDTPFPEMKRVLEAV